MKPLLPKPSTERAAELQRRLERQASGQENQPLVAVNAVAVTPRTPKSRHSITVPCELIFDDEATKSPSMVA